VLGHNEILESLLTADSDDVCYAVVAKSTGELVAQAGNKECLPYPGMVEAALSPENIVARYEECEHNIAANMAALPRGYARDRISVVIGIVQPDLLVVSFGQMPDTLSVANADVKVAWYWAHRRRVWAAVEAAYAEGACAPPPTDLCG